VFDVVANIWDVGVGNVVCIPTNGIVKRDGALVMGAGLAQQAANKFPGIASKLGRMVKAEGNIVHFAGDWKATNWQEPYRVVSFPTKDHFKDPSSLDLIAKSAEQLVALADLNRYEPGWQKIFLPKVGAGLGRLPWRDVRGLLAKLLDDRFYVATL
jgi:hypothetical protein